MTIGSASTPKPFSFGRLVLRSAAAFGLLGAAGFALFLIVDGDNPLRSDDPYIVGILFGAVSAAAAAIYTTLESFVRRSIIVDFIYFGLLSTWSLMLLVSTLGANEARELGKYLAAGSMIAGTIAWPLCRFRIPTWFAVGASLLGVVLVAMYFVVAARLGFLT